MIQISIKLTYQVGLSDSSLMMLLRRVALVLSSRLSLLWRVSVRLLLVWNLVELRISTLRVSNRLLLIMVELSGRITSRLLVRVELGCRVTGGLLVWVVCHRVSGWLLTVVLVNWLRISVEERLGRVSHDVPLRLRRH
jgi:hypothetical protein